MSALLGLQLADSLKCLPKSCDNTARSVGLKLDVSSQSPGLLILIAVPDRRVVHISVLAGIAPDANLDTTLLKGLYCEWLRCAVRQSLLLVLEPYISPFVRGYKRERYSRADSTFKSFFNLIVVKRVHGILIFKGTLWQ